MAFDAPGLHDGQAMALYREMIRLAVALDLEVDRLRLELSPGVGEVEVDDYLRLHVGEIMRRIKSIYCRDIEIHELRVAENLRTALRRPAVSRHVEMEQP